jgi:hypothetical protein
MTSWSAASADDTEVAAAQSANAPARIIFLNFNFSREFLLFGF